MKIVNICCLNSGWGSFCKSKSHNRQGTTQAWFPTGEPIHGRGSCRPTSLPTGFSEWGLCHISHTLNGSPQLTIVKSNVIEQKKKNLYLPKLSFQKIWEAKKQFLCERKWRYYNISFVLKLSHTRGKYRVPICVAVANVAWALIQKTSQEQVGTQDPGP